MTFGAIPARIVAIPALPQKNSKPVLVVIVAVYLAANLLIH